MRQRDSQVRLKRFVLCWVDDRGAFKISGSVVGSWRFRCAFSQELSWYSRIMSFSNRGLVSAFSGIEITAVFTASSRGAMLATMCRREASSDEGEIVAVTAMCLGNGLRLHSAWMSCRLGVSHGN